MRAAPESAASPRGDWSPGLEAPSRCPGTLPRWDIDSASAFFPGHTICPHRRRWLCANGWISSDSPAHAERRVVRHLRSSSQRRSSTRPTHREPPCQQSNNARRSCQRGSGTPPSGAQCPPRQKCFTALELVSATSGRLTRSMRRAPSFMDTRFAPRRRRLPLCQWVSLLGITPLTWSARSPGASVLPPDLPMGSRLTNRARHSCQRGSGAPPSGAQCPPRQKWFTALGPVSVISERLANSTR